MKLLCCAALLLSGYAQAGELRPMTGEESEDMQYALAEALSDVVSALPAGVTVQPVLDRIKHSGWFKRITLGPMAGTSYVVLRIRITDAGGNITQEVFTNEAGAWRGTFQPRIDSTMIEQAAEQARNFVMSYALVD